MINLKQEIGGGYSDIPLTTVDVYGGDGKPFQVTVAKLNPGFNITEQRFHETEAEALKDYRDTLARNLLPLQAAVFAADLKIGGKYTILYHDDFGSPCVVKFRLNAYKCGTWAQYGDCIHMKITPYRARSAREMRLFKKSFAIYKGWQDFPQERLWETISESPVAVMRKMKYGGWNPALFEECADVLRDRVCLYKNYRTGKNGRVFA